MICKDIEAFNDNIKKSGRLMGVDMGRINIGVAVSDESRLIATPRTTIKRKSNATDFEIFANFIKENEIVGIVMGLPLSAEGKDTDTSKYVQRFTEGLNEFLQANHNLSIPIYYHNEAMSSKYAEDMLINSFDLSRQKRKKVIDKVAAGYILQDVLDMS